MRSIDIGEVEYFDTLATRLLSAGRGKKGQLIEEAASFLKTSRDGIYKGLRSVGWESGRKRRTDRGNSRADEGVAAFVSNIMLESTRANGKRLLSATDALEIAQAHGVDINVSTSTLLREMKRHGCHPDQIAKPPPHTTLRSLHPNHVFEVDPSVCVLFYLDDGGLAVMDEKRFYKNKPENIAKISKKRVLRYVLTDHYTGTIFVKYYLVSGENQETLFDFLMDAFSKREHSQDPFHGVPLYLIWDAGSANQSYLIKNLLVRLLVKVVTHGVGAPRVKGQVECANNLIERGFEGRLSLMQVRHIDHLNECAHIWMRNYNANRIHRRHGQSRYGLWQTIREEQLRICPPRELCSELLRTKPESRQVKGNLVVSYTVPGYGSKTYSVEKVPGVRVGESVNVCVNPYKAPNIFVITEDADGNEILHECVPEILDAAGFPIDAPVIGESFKSAPDTDTDKHRKSMAKAAYDADTQQEVDQARKERKPAFGGRIDPISYLEEETVAHFMARPGIELDIPGRMEVVVKPLTVIEACKQLRVLLKRDITQEENQQIREWYPQGVQEEEIPALLISLGGAVPSKADSKLSIVS
ncbi:MAG: transposase [Candidatus Sedimenticola sp. (ex Thyasira tokunagai)]